MYTRLDCIYVLNLADGFTIRPFLDFCGVGASQYTAPTGSPSHALHISQTPIHHLQLLLPRHSQPLHLPHAPPCLVRSPLLLKHCFQQPARPLRILRNPAFLQRGEELEDFCLRVRLERRVARDEEREDDVSRFGEVACFEGARGEGNDEEDAAFGVGFEVRAGSRKASLLREHARAAVDYCGLVEKVRLV